VEPDGQIEDGFRGRGKIKRGEVVPGNLERDPGGSAEARLQKAVMARE